MTKAANVRSGRRKAAPSPAEVTREALIRAALKLFGRQGFEGTSTREIAAAANANIGSIAYHFGGKEGLHAAAADYIVETVQTIAAQALGNVQAPAMDADPEAARAQLFATLERMVLFFVVTPEAGDIAQFMLREVSQPTTALDRIYQGVFEPLHRRLCLIWEQATGEPAESERTRLTVFTLIGQVVYFRIGRDVVLKRMGWDGIGDKEADKVLGVMRDNLGAILAARKGENT
ncbi:TetR family transcriptional regulator [Mesorhizobium sp. Root157]|uniref:CerR family C-terminal domain-containing protein n=1 Tax=Mesorhizobium sp. Root157 TaxID=1736477 RepID=UPI0006F44776|nr:CerR family C-terminal domain-containing protein [Mesorhizobium sp. Root157]KQZ93975.1 TetR family transcriptional regulator [Mesorhizobium sp. Root157]